MDDPGTIEAMIHFMYGFDYDSSRGGVSPMLFNARVYKIAEKYRIPQLKERAKAKFEDTVRTCWDMDDFPLVVREIYTGTISTDRGLRNVVAETANNHIKSLLRKDDVLSVLEECGGFSADVLQLLARGSGPTSTTKYNCPSCGNRWEGGLLEKNRSYYCLNCGSSRSNWSQYAVK